MAQGQGAIEAHGLRQIDLADHHQISALEHGGVFEGLVFSFGHREEHQPLVLAQIKGGGTDEVAHIFNPQQIQGLQGMAGGRQGVEASVHHGGLQMAGLARGDLHGRQARLPQPAGVVVGGQIPHQGGQAQAGGSEGGQCLQQRGLAGSRGREKIHHPHAGLAEVLPVVGRQLVVAG